MTAPASGGEAAAAALAGRGPATEKARCSEAVARARSAQRLWVGVAPKARARALGRLARALHRNSDAIVARIRAETAKPPVEALTEVVVSVDLLRFYARRAAAHLRPRRVGTGWMVWKRAWVEREPYGVVGAITPWNYPFILPMDCVSPAVCAGNAVILKPSEFTPGSALLIPGLCREAGLPDDLVQVLPGGGDTGRALVEAGVDRLVFTGSTSTGRKIMEGAAHTLTPVTLELGGKDPAFVLDDANVRRAARGVVFGGLFNAGQTCLSIERVYVARPVYQEFLQEVVALVGKLRVGTGPDVDVGPMVTEAQADIVERQVADALEKGARALTGGKREAPGSRVFLPTVLVDVDETMDVLREETFGPVLPVVLVEDDEGAVRRSRRCGYGLFASVWTANRQRGLEVARQVRAGGVSVNDVLAHYGVPALPMGGVALSGFGSRRGLEALDEMSRPRSLFVDRLGARREPWWLPYSPGGERLTRAVLDWRGLGGLRGAARAVARLLGRGS